MMASLFFRRLIVFMAMVCLIVSINGEDSSLESYYSTSEIATSEPMTTEPTQLATIPPPPHATIHEHRTSNVKQSTSNKNDDNKDDEAVGELIDTLVREYQDMENETSDESKDEDVTDYDYIDNDIFNCKVPPKMDEYCTDIQGKVREYFHGNVTIFSVLATIFDKTIVNNLRLNCPRYSWCSKEDVHQNIKKGKSAFYASNPICSSVMVSCLKALVELEEDIGCDNELLDFLINSADLLCSLEEVGKTVVDEECYARTVELLYVMYVGLTFPNKSLDTEEFQTGCSDERKQLSTTYKCAEESCTGNRKYFLEKFSYLQLVAEIADETDKSCKIEHKCRPANTNNDYDYSPPSTATSTSDYEYGDEQSIEFDSGKQGEDDEENKENGANDNLSSDANRNYIQETERTDSSFMLGLVVITTVAILGFLGLAFLGYRRFFRVKYDKTGYSKLLDEEAKLLQAEYS